MATNFPTSLDALTNPTSSDALSSPSHSAQHANANDAIEALQAKVGINSSAVTTTLDYKINNDLVAKSAYTAKGAILAASAASTPAVLAVGANGLILAADSTQTNGVRYGGPVAELVNVVASAATGTINVNADTAPVWFYTSNATANFTLNLRESASVSLNTFLPVGQAMTIVFANTNGATPYYCSAVQIDGSAVTPRWLGGAAPTAGNASSIDVYTFTIIKTAATPTYTVLASQTRFA